MIKKEVDSLIPLLNIGLLNGDFVIYADKSNGRKIALASFDGGADRKLLSLQIGRSVLAYYDMISDSGGNYENCSKDNISLSEIFLLIERLDLNDSIDQVRVIDQCLLKLIEEGDTEADDFYKSLWLKKKREILLKRR